MLKKVIGKRDSMWSGIVLIVVVGMLVAVYFLKLSYGPDLVNVNIEPLLVTPKSHAKAVEDVSLDTYESTVYNFKVDYPKSWQVTISSIGEGETEIFSLSLENESNSVGISVMSDEMEGLVRNSISITSESEVEVNGTVAKKLEGGSLKDGSPFTMILIKEQDRLYSIEGTGQEFDQIVNYFQLL